MHLQNGTADVILPDFGGSDVAGDTRNESGTRKNRLEIFSASNHYRIFSER